MKRLAEKRWFLPAALLALYLLTAFSGVAVVGGFPVFSEQKDFLFRHAREIAAQYLAGVPEEAGAAEVELRKMVYDGEGRLVFEVSPPVVWPNSVPDARLQGYLSAVLSGREIYRFVYAWEMNDLIVVAGVPAMDEGTPAGAVFVMRNLKNVPESVEAYLVFFTVVFCVAAYFTVSSARKKRKLEELQRAYIANVTHTLKTPVSSVKALAEALCDEVVRDPVKQKMYHGRILLEAKKQERMIRDILELSELQSRGRDFTKTAVGAEECFAPVLENYAEVCECALVALHVSDALYRLPPLYTNADCARELLEILLENAMKFAPEGDVWVEAAVSGRAAVVTVRDNGVGIPPEDLPRVFDRFFKSKAPGNESGSGLGLAIAKEIADGLRERLRAESEPGGGAAFSFTIQLK